MHLTHQAHTVTAMGDANGYLTVREAAARLRCSERMMLKLIHTGRISAVDVSSGGTATGTWRITEQALTDYITASTVHARSTQ